MDKKVHSAGVINQNELSGRPVGLRQFNYDFLAVTFSGEAFFLWENQGISVKVEPISMVYVPAGQNHIYDPCIPSRWQNCWVLFNGDKARQAFNKIFPIPGVTQLKDISKLKQYWLQMSTYMLNENEFSDECAFCMLHNIFMEAKLQSLSSQKHQPSDITIDLINLMRKNLHNPELDFESLASQNGIMPESLNKRFKKETGMPLHQYFLQLKINAAKSILANLNYRISDLADFLGFEDQYYFSRLFKKKTGLSPINYRKQMILKQQPEFVKKEKKSRKP